jgi:hypothetical protein
MREEFASYDFLAVTVSGIVLLGCRLFVVSPSLGFESRHREFQNDPANYRDVRLL